MTTMTRPITAQFVCSYRGEHTYRIGSESYHIRRAAYDGIYVEGYFESGIVPTVGCVYGGDIQQFPPAEVLALFPGYVAARWDMESKRWMYRGEAPRVTRKSESEVTADVWTEELARHSL